MIQRNLGYLLISGSELGQGYGGETYGEFAFTDQRDCLTSIEKVGHLERINASTEGGEQRCFVIYRLCSA